MNTFLTYSIITALVVLICRILFRTFLGDLKNLQIMHNMLHLELINDLVVSNVYLKNQSFDNYSIQILIQKFQLYFQVNNPSFLKGTRFILFLEEWLMKVMYFQETSFQFYADKELYLMDLDSETKYGISLWLATLLQCNPDYIDLSLIASPKSIGLKVKKLTKNRIPIDLDTYLYNLAYDNLPGNFRISPDSYLIIEFKKPKL